MEMPSLEILDVSRNEIVELPEEPGRLVQLRVSSRHASALRRPLIGRSDRYSQYLRTGSRDFLDI